MKTEKIVALIFLVGVILKFIPIPLGGVLLILSLSTIAILYFPGAFYFFSDKNLKRQNLALSIVSGLLLSLIPIGILFKLKYWPGSGHINLLVGAVASCATAMIAYIKLKSADDLKTYYKNLFLRTVVLFVLAITFFLIPTATLIQMQYRKDPELARLKTLSYTNPDNQEYSQQLHSFEMHRDSIQQSKAK